jgi:hypothetical protein
LTGLAVAMELLLVVQSIVDDDLPRNNI